MFGILGEKVVDKGVEGYNGTIFAYGQTGSGKTYSNDGVQSDEGLIPELNFSLFESLKKISTDLILDYFITVSYMRFIMR